MPVEHQPNGSSYRDSHGISTISYPASSQARGSDIDNRSARRKECGCFECNSCFDGNSCCPDYQRTSCKDRKIPVKGLVVVAVLIAYPFVMILVGAIQLDDCPAERFIPIYLLVAGSFSFVTITCAAFCMWDGYKPFGCGCLSAFAVILLFMIAWFIAGVVWITRTNGEKRSDDDTAPNYCNPDLYRFSVSVIVFTFLVLLLMCGALSGGRGRQSGGMYGDAVAAGMGGGYACD